MAEKKEGAPDGRTVRDRWWAEFNEKRRDTIKPVAGPAGMSFFRAGQGFEQERAVRRLTDNNLKLLIEANPPEGGWGYVQLAESQFATAECERIKRELRLPSYARGVVVDSGRSLRLLFTGTPIGVRILEIALGDAPSFDCWVEGEWVREELFERVEDALAATPGFVEQYLSPAGIAAWESLRARA
jgi:hypothetical protein